MISAGQINTMLDDLSRKSTVISPPLSEGPSADICLSAVTCYLWQGQWGQNTTIDPVNIDGPNGIDDEGKPPAIENAMHCRERLS